MKHFSLIIIAAMLVMGLGACNQNKNNVNDKKLKVLVAYFSATGTTEKVAQQIADATGGELYRITPEQPYTDADLDWHNDKSRSSVEMSDKSSRPAIKKDLNDVKQYDVIFVGFPIWWYTAPTIINTFIESQDFKGKTVITFATSGGSTIDKADGDLHLAYPDINWKPGHLLNRASDEEVKEWVKTCLN